MGLSLLPGPCNLEENVRDALATSIKNWDSLEFLKLYRNLQNDIKNLLNCDVSLVLSTPEQHAIEMLFSSMFDEKDSVLLLSNGFYGNRLAKILDLYNIKVVNAQLKDETPITYAAGKNYINELKGKINGVILNFVESSTGVRNDVLEISEYAKEQGLLTVVNGITAVGSEECNMGEWLVDACVFASHHGMGMPPGISFIGLSNEAVDKINKVNRPQYFSGLKSHFAYLSREEIPFTPAVTLYYGAEKAIENIKKIGIDEWIIKQKRVAKYVRENLSKLGIKVFAPEDHAANGLTTFFVENAQIIKNMLFKEYGIEIADGVGQWKNTTLRIGHMGAVYQPDYALFFDAFEEILKKAPK